jgi:hypothetical protein
MKIFLALALALFLAGCSTSPVQYKQPMLHTSIAAGQVVQLNQPLTVAAQRVDAGVQFGRETVSLDPWEPHCKFEINTLRDRDVTLPAGDYLITRVSRRADPYYSQRNGSKMMVAAAENAAFMAFAGNQDSFWYYATIFRLESEEFPDIRQLICGEMWPSGFDARDITLEKFENTIGDVITIKKQ